MLSGLLEVLRVLNLPCREHSLLISRMADGDVSRATRIGLRLHFVLCGPCRHFAAHLVFFRKAAARLGNAAAASALEASRMPADVRARLSARLRNDRDFM